MKVALIHDWLVSYRGGEKVLEAIAELFPEAELFTLFHEKGSVSPVLEARRIRTSLLDGVPFARAHYRHLLPLLPFAVERLDLSGFELVVSSSHCVAKGVRAPKGAKHLSYVHAPMRYMWDRYEDYFGPGRASLPVRAAAYALRPALRRWDRNSAQGVDRFVANSHYIAGRIATHYGRQAAVVHPPVELERFCAHGLEGSGSGDYFLWVGALAPYKRADLAMEAFAQLGRPLWIAGSGQDAARLARNAPPGVRLLGQVSDEQLVGLYRNTRALVFTAEEDFGITPLEAQASGRPVIALGRGGALETITPQTGLFFERPEVDSLVQAVRQFDAWENGFRPEVARAHARRFTKASFQSALRSEIDALLAAPLG